MSNLLAKISFYEIDSCGFFKWRERDPSFGNATDIFGDLHTWISNDRPTVRETKTFNVGQESSVLPCYCFNILKNQQDEYLLTLWNEGQTVQGQFAAVIGDEIVGGATVETSDVPEGGIPGHPTYFYIVPKINMIAAIRFDGTTTGIRNLNKYMRGFLERFSCWTVVANEDDCLNSEIIGYRENEGDTPLKSFYPRFLTRLKRKDGEIALIKKKRQLIRKIIRKDEYQVSIQKKQDVVEAFLSFFSINGDNSIPTGAKYRFEFDYTPTEAELNSIIRNWENDEEGTAWDDVGFKLKGTNETYWLGTANIHDDFHLELPVGEGGVIDSNSLLTAMSEKKERLQRKFRGN